MQLASVKLDGSKTTTADGIITLTVSAGEHKLTKADSCNLFYMVFRTEGGTVTAPAAETTSVTTAAAAETTAAPVSAETTSAAPETTAPAETTAAAPTKRGDVNCDGKITISDAIMLARVVAEDATVQVTETGLQNAELDGESGLSANDTTTLLKIIAGMIS